MKFVFDKSDMLNKLLFAKEVISSKNAMSIVAAADYCISIKDGYEFPDDFQQKFDAFLTQEKIMMRKKTKKSDTSL